MPDGRDRIKFGCFEDNIAYLDQQEEPLDDDGIKFFRLLNAAMQEDERSWRMRDEEMEKEEEKEKEGE